jgi:hypothetical protein
MNQVVENETEKKALLSEMVRFQSDLGISGIGWMETFTKLLIELPTAWFIVKKPLQEKYAELWEQKYGKWSHGSGNTESHNKLGMAYAWWAVHEVNSLSDIKLSDSPDFSGSMPLPDDMHDLPMMVRICGDIQKCSPVAMFKGLTTLNFHDVWISVVDWDTQIFVQFGYSVARYIQINRWSRLGKIDDYQRAIQKTFFCKGCNEWSIAEKSRKMLIEWHQSQ